MRRGSDQATVRSEPQEDVTELPKAATKVNSGTARMRMRKILMSIR